MDAGVNSFQITLDGSEPEHNKTRIGGNSGSFNAIMQNLLAMRRSTRRFNTLIKLHLHASNIESIKGVIDDLEIDFSGDIRFKITIQKIINYRQQNAIAIANHHTEQLAFEHLAFVFQEQQILRPSKILNCCYASLPNHFVIRANGKVQKCTVALYDERNDVGELTPDGSFRWHSQERLASWSAGLLEGNLEKMQCPWRAMQKADRQ